jgi:NADP-dependent 3-hydroxy acid dehydrogenase YdfG
MASEKVAFITGGNKGIGLETARQLGKLGIKVVIGARDLAKGNEAIAKLKADGVTAETVKFDITKAADYKEVYKYLDQHFGKLDILVNNAGISKEDFLAGNKTSNTSAELLHETFDTNFFGAVELTQVLLPLIKKAPAGRIVNLSSILGSISLHADPKSPIYDAKAFAYDASKSAHRASGARAEGYEDQGQLRAPGLGEDRHGRRAGAAGHRYRRKDQRETGNTARRWTDRRVHPPGPDSALVRSRYWCRVSEIRDKNVLWLCVRARLQSCHQGPKSSGL